MRKIAKLVKRTARRALGLDNSAQTTRVMLLLGSVAATGVRTLDRVATLQDAEFSVFSQWGEDGILEWIIHQNGEMPDSFVEFGVEDYSESNTRFLIQNRNWKGIIIDGSFENMMIARADAVSWRHGLTSIPAFITRDNINDLISGGGLTGEIGLLSVDIDGNDYWVWDAITCVNPQIVVAEYNSAFGDLHPLSVPYKSDFVRTSAHPSNLYYGASISALEQLARQKGYVLIGSNSAGSNAFFVREDRLPRFDGKIADRRARPSRFREARDATGQLTFANGAERSKVIGDCLVTNVIDGTTAPLSSFGDLYSERWRALL